MRRAVSQTGDRQAAYVEPFTRAGAKAIRMVYPERVLNVQSKNQLEGLLDHYNTPIWQSRVARTPGARRNYVEKIRPALRYFCKLYNVKIPDWLADDKQFAEMGAGAVKELFGVDKLRIFEFRSKHLEPPTEKSDAPRQ